MKIVLVNSHLMIGGAERVLSTMANYWVAHGEEVSLITLALETTDFYSLDSRVKRVGLNLASSSKNMLETIWNTIARILQLRATLRKEKPDVIISFQDRTNVLTLLATRGLSIPVIVSERNDPRKRPIDWVWDKLRCWFYPKAEYLIVQVSDLIPWAARIVPEHQVRVIPNPISPAAVQYSAQSPNRFPKPFIVGMGRLMPQKGFDLLLEAFSNSDHAGWSLVILGEGQERKRLESLIEKLELGGSVILPGVYDEPAMVLREADLFAMPSRYEGFPNALLEAMGCGLPVISFDCPSGPSDIITDGVDGILVPPENTTALSASLTRLMANVQERTEMGEKARGVLDRFAVDDVMKQWNRLVNEVVK